MHNGKRGMPRRKNKSHASAWNVQGIVKRLFHPSADNDHRARILHPEALFYFSLIVLASFALLKAFRFFPSLEHSILGYASNITPEQVILQTNEKRAEQGLPSLRLNEELSQAAQAKGQNMFAQQYWSHTAPDGTEPWYFVEQSGYKYKIAGENLARDFMNTGDMVQAWMASPTHRANVLNAKFEEIGIAVIDGKLNGFETTLVVQMFGAPAPAGTPSKTPDKVALKPSVLAEQDTEEKGVDEKEDKLTEKTTEPAFSEVTSATGVSPQLFRDSVLLTPLQLTKAFFLAVILLVVMTLIYDTLIAGNTKTAHLVGKNMGHLMVFGAVAFMLIFFKGGMVN